MYTNHTTISIKEIPLEELASYYHYQYYNLTLQQLKQEWDVLVIFPDIKYIINIEVKLGPRISGNKLNLLHEASNQTEKHLSYFLKLFGSKLSDNWKFIKAACVPYLKEEKDADSPCKQCKTYILKENDIFDISSWIEDLTCNKDQYTNRTDYEHLLSTIIGHSSLQDFYKNGLIISPLDNSKMNERSITGNNPGISGDSEYDDKYMLNTEQYKAVHNKSSVLVIDGDYGTGKTFVLKERAKMCANQNKDETIAYVNLTGLIIDKKFSLDQYTCPTTMDYIAEIDFDEYPNVEVISCCKLLPNHFSNENNCYIEEIIIKAFETFFVINS